MEETLRHTLAEGAAAIGCPLGQPELDLFAAYHRELLLWNQRINLVSERASREIVIRHFLDSLTAVPWIARPEGLLIDIGSGGGFPGIPLQIVLPGLQATLVESSRKKTSFLSHIIRTLALDNMTVIRERIEVLIGERACASQFDTVISRAAFKLPELLRMASFFLKPDGLLIAMKGPDLQAELDEAQAVLKSTGMALAAIRDIRLPGTDLTRKIVTYNRVSG
jgi:16S rRNA (guanine527-N7)-methyltransferase